MKGYASIEENEAVKMIAGRDGTEIQKKLVAWIIIQPVDMHYSYTVRGKFDKVEISAFGRVGDLFMAERGEI